MPLTRPSSSESRLSPEYKKSRRPLRSSGLEFLLGAGKILPSQSDTKKAENSCTAGNAAAHSMLATRYRKPPADTVAEDPVEQVPKEW